MKVLKYVITGIGVLAIAAILTFHFFFRLPLPDYEGNIEIPGLLSDVEVHFDDYGVPHVFARNDHDLFFERVRL